MTPSMCHVIPSMCHVTPSMCHVTPSMCHVTPSMCHVTPSMCHVTPSMCHVTPSMVVSGEECKGYQRGFTFSFHDTGAKNRWVVVWLKYIIASEHSSNIHILKYY